MLLSPTNWEKKNQCKGVSHFTIANVIIKSVISDVALSSKKKVVYET